MDPLPAKAKRPAWSSLPESWRQALWRRLLFLFGFGALVALLALISVDLTFGTGSWLEEDDPENISQRTLFDTFLHDEDIVLVLHFPDGIWRERAIKQMAGLADALDSKPYIRETLSLLSATVAIDDGRSLRFEAYHDAWRDGFLPDLDAWRAEFRKSPYWGRLVDDAGRHAVFVIGVDSGGIWGDVEERFARLHSVRNSIQAELQARNHGAFSAHFAGEGWLALRLQDGASGELGDLLIAVFILVALLLYYFLRSLARVVLLLAINLVAVLAQLAWFTLLDQPMTIIALGLIVLLVVITTSDGVHILARWDEQLRHHRTEPRAAFIQTIRLSWRPCLMTSLTTSIGFGAFAFSKIEPLSDLGKNGFIGVLLAYGLVITLLFGALRLFRSVAAPGSASVRFRFLIDGARWIIARRPALACAGLLAISLILSLGLVRAYAETNFLHAFFSQSSKEYKDFKLIDDHLTGSGAIELLVEAAPDQDDWFKQLDTLRWVISLRKTLLAHPEIRSVSSYADPLSIVHRKLVPEKEDLPDEENLLAQELLLLEFSRSETRPDVLEPFVDFDFRRGRVGLSTRNLNSSDIRRLLDDIDERMPPAPAGAKVTPSGTNVYFNQLSGYIIDTQVSSVLITFGLITALFALLIGPAYAVAAVVASAASLSAVLGVVALAGLPFDFAMVLVASVGIGMNVDHAVHLTAHFKHARASGVVPSMAASHALASVGPPALASVTLFAAGFAVF